jgi:phage terminase large subunit GpA-like protein
VTFVAGTQVAKTEIGNNFIGYIIDVGAGPDDDGLPDVEHRQAQLAHAPRADDRGDAQLRAKISENSRDKSNSASLKEFPGGVLAIAGSNSAAELKSMPVRYLFEDEVDEYPDDVDGQGPA